MLPRDRNKTLTALAGTEPVVGSKHREAQRLEHFLVNAPWEAEEVTDRRVALLKRTPATAPHEGGVLVIDDTGDRKDGHATAHVGTQYLGSRGKVENGIVAVTAVWADEHCYYPLFTEPYTPAHHFPRGKADPGFRTKLVIGAHLAARAAEAGFAFRAVVADAAYGDQDGFRADLWSAHLPFVMALKPHRGTWAREEAAHTPIDAARALAWSGPDDPGAWQAVTRRFRDGHTETWWAADATLGGWGPDGRIRLVVATNDPATLPPKTTWYLATDLPRPGSPRAGESGYRAADLAEIVRIYGLRNWIEQGYKQVKDELGWADFQVRSDKAIRRHWALVNCAFCFCWLQETFEHDEDDNTGSDPPVPPSWPGRLRRIRSWLAPLSMLARIWRGWTTGPLPAELKTLSIALTNGHGISLYTPP